MFVFPVNRGAEAHTHFNGYARAFKNYERLLDGTLERACTRSDTNQSGRSPALDVQETDTSYVATLDMPGVAKEDVKVNIEGRRVSIEAQTQSATPPDESKRMIYRERVQTKFARVLTLPNEIDQTASAAKLENGVLTLTLQKRQTSQASTLNVN